MFKPQFAELVADGRKRQTIRPLPKRLPAVGDTISLRCWEGLPYRSKQRVLRESEIVAVVLIKIGKGWMEIMNEFGQIKHTSRRDQLDEAAEEDGFRDWQEMSEWFLSQHDLPFQGVLIRWANVSDQATASARRC